MRYLTTSFPNDGASADRRRNVAIKAAAASLALFAVSFSSANSAPLHDNNHLHNRAGYAGISNPAASPPNGAWTNTTRKPVYIFGQPVDP
jgi:hypothetical protein